MEGCKQGEVIQHHYARDPKWPYALDIEFSEDGISTDMTT